MFWRRTIKNFLNKYKVICENNTVKSDYEKGVNILGHIKSEHGVGEAVRTNIKSCKNAGIDVCLINIALSHIRQCDFSFPEFSDNNHFYINLIHVNADMLPLYCAEKGNDYFKGKYNIGIWNWELSDFPDDWIKSFSYCNEIWVPSNFTLTAISKKSPVPVFKMPYAVEVNELKKVNRSYFGFKESDFLFLFLFDFLSYFERKNPLAIIESFKKSFSAIENVRLVIKCSNSSFDQKAMNLMKESVNNHNVTIIDNYFYREEVNGLMYLCDSYISLHRSEGFGFTLAEAMFLGKPVIATGYSANADFMNNRNSFLVKYKLISIKEDVGPYKKNSFWAEPDVDHAAELMRYIYENRETANKVGNKAAAEIKKKFSPLTIGRGIKNRVSHIYNNYPKICK